MAASQQKVNQSCVAGHCTLNVRRLTDGADGTVYYLCGAAQSRERPAAPCRIYRLDSYRDVSAPPAGPGKRKSFLSRLLHL